MFFNSIEFAAFFAVVFSLYCALNHRWQNRMLLAASYIFYGWVEPRFVILMAFTTAADYYLGQRIEESAQSAKKRWLTASVVMNLTLLGAFKYYGFFAENVRALAESLGFEAHWYIYKLALPAGISFYTFHEISYVVDIHRGHIKAARSFEDFACFISFFPQLVAGPIGRASWQMPQFQKPRVMTWEGWADGATLFVTGLFRKVVVADSLGALAKPVFDQPENCSPLTLLIGLYFFSFQIYADFAGYSEMARGLARFMGFELIQNFTHPYFSTSITEFWRRWHISLSTWLRDYLYIPLGGNRHGKLRTYLNLFLTMFLGGLWHGAAWTYAIWGSLHGVYLAIHKLMLDRPAVPGNAGFQPAPPGTAGILPASGAAGFQPASFALSLLKCLATFHLVAFTWIFFNEKPIHYSFGFLRGLFGANSSSTISFDRDVLGWGLTGLAIMILLIDLPQFLKKDPCVFLRWPFYARVAAFFILVMTTILIRGDEHVPFIYFKF